MGLLPENHAERIAFFTSRTALWTTNATAIGTTTTQVTDVTTKAAAATTALAAQLAAQNAAKAATQTLFDAMDALTNSGSIVIEQVRTKSRTAGEGVYPLANLPAPATPSPKPAPGQPTELVVSLTQTGAFDMKWKCPNPPGTQGTVYNVFRRVGSVGEYTFIGGSGVREFTDETVPSGAALIMYKIQAVRSTAVGPFATFNVFIGTGAGGATMITSVVETTSPKMAA
ncbi:MAG: hypothetical protein QOF78_3400 [Phycisphaerales bacterium]|jgi:hypothetical protein|nr:hypothetical protein [Phycisphaerales bacterium]